MKFYFASLLVFVATFPSIMALPEPVPAPEPQATAPGGGPKIGA